MNYATFWKQDQLSILAGLIVEYGPLNWPITAGVLTERCSQSLYYMAQSRKDWELPNSRIWLAEMDIDRGLDFPI